MQAQVFFLNSVRIQLKKGERFSAPLLLAADSCVPILPILPIFRKIHSKKIALDPISENQQNLHPSGTAGNRPRCSENEEAHP